MTDLKPCPFCGSKPALINFRNGELYYIICNNCRAMMGSQSISTSALYGKQYFDNEKDCVDAWNRRV